MNERIRRLVRESHLDVYGLGLDRAKWEHTIEKFAELIVRECAQEFDNTYMSGGKTMGAYIREKFGVKE
jgi:hypothetical protein